MKIDPSQSNECARFLRMSLRGNALFSTLSGIAFVLLSGTIAAILGDYPAGYVLAVGFQLLVFAGALAWLSSQAEISTPLTIGVIVADCLWVLGTGVVVYADFFTRQGNILLLGLADVVLLLAILQFLGVRRMKAGLLGVES